MFSAFNEVFWFLMKYTVFLLNFAGGFTACSQQKVGMQLYQAWLCVCLAIVTDRRKVLAIHVYHQPKDIRILQEACQMWPAVCHQSFSRDP